MLANGERGKGFSSERKKESAPLRAEERLVEGYHGRSSWFFKKSQIRKGAGRGGERKEAMGFFNAHKGRGVFASLRLLGGSRILSFKIKSKKGKDSGGKDLPGGGERNSLCSGPKKGRRANRELETNRFFARWNERGKLAEKRGARCFRRLRLAVEDDWEYAWGKKGLLKREEKGGRAPA